MIKEGFEFPKGWGEIDVTPQMEAAASKWSWLLGADPERDRFPDDFDPEVEVLREADSVSDVPNSDNASFSPKPNK